MLRMMAKDGWTVKQENLVVVKRERSVGVILPVALLWHSARPLQRKRNHPNVLVGRIKRLMVAW